PGWMVGGTTLTSTRAVASTAAVDERFEFTVAGIADSCRTFHAIDPKINGVTLMSDVASLVFGECEIQAGRGSPPCSLPTKTIGTLPLLIDNTLDGAAAIKGRILPANSSKVFVTIKYDGAECPLSGLYPVDGAWTVLVPMGQNEGSDQLVVSTNEEP